jgi:hypothetical protein
MSQGRGKVFLENIIRDTVTYTEHARRKTVNVMDVVSALKCNGGGDIAQGKCVSKKNLKRPDDPDVNEDVEIGTLANEAERLRRE